MKLLIRIIFALLFVCQAWAQTLSRPASGPIDTTAFASKADLKSYTPADLTTRVLMSLLVARSNVPTCSVADLPTNPIECTASPIRIVPDMLLFGGTSAVGDYAFYNQATGTWRQASGLAVTTDYLTFFRSIAQVQPVSARSTDACFYAGLNTAAFSASGSTNANGGSVYGIEAEYAATLHVNTSTNGAALIGSATGVFPMVPTALTHRYTRVVFRHSGLSDNGTVRTYWSQIGNGAGMTFPTNGTLQANGAFFLTDAQNVSTYLGTAPGTVLVCVTRTGSGAAQTATVTSVTPSISSAAYDVGEINESPGQVEFYLNGNLVATHKTNIPTAAPRPGVSIVGTAGTNDRSLYLRQYQIIALP